MGNRPLYKIERIHMLGTPESEGLKVTALNLFHPTTSLSLQHVSFFCDTVSGGRQSRIDSEWAGFKRSGRVRMEQ